jgi:hypothetical protein
MAPINRIDTAETSAVDAPESIPRNQGSPASPVSEQPMETADPSTAAAKKLERDLEANYFRGQLDEAQSHAGVGVLYDRNAKPEPGKGSTATETAAPVSKAAPVRVADAGDDLNTEVATNAARWVGKPVVGSGECYDYADQVLKDADAKSAPDFGKVTKSEKDNYKWGTPIGLKDVKPGDILQFRDHKVVIETKKKVTKTFPDGHKVTTEEKSSQELKRGQHTAVVLANNGDGTMTVAEQHVLDHSTGKLSTTVRKNTLNTQDVPATKKTKTTHQGNVKIEEETTVTISVKGNIWPYRPQQKKK